MAPPCLAPGALSLVLCPARSEHNQVLHWLRALRLLQATDSGVHSHCSKEPGRLIALPQPPLHGLALCEQVYSSGGGMSSPRQSLIPR